MNDDKENEDEEEDDFLLGDELLQIESPERKRQESDEIAGIPDVKDRLFLPNRGSSNGNHVQRVWKPKNGSNHHPPASRGLTHGSSEDQKQDGQVASEELDDRPSFLVVSSINSNDNNEMPVESSVQKNNNQIIPEKITPEKKSGDGPDLVAAPADGISKTLLGQVNINLNENDVILMLSSQIKKELSERIKSEMESNAQDILREVKDKFIMDIITTVKYQIEYDLKNKYQEMIINWAKNFLKPQLKDELKFSITQDIKKDLESEFLEDVKSDLIYQAKTAIMESIQDLVKDLGINLRDEIRIHMENYIRKKVDVEVRKSEVENPVHLVFVDFNNLWELAQKYSYTRRVDIAHVIKRLYSILSDGDDNLSPNRVEGYVFFSKYHECEISGIRDYKWPEEPLLTELMTRFKWEMVSARKMGEDTGYRDIDINLAVNATELIVKNTSRILTLTIVSGDGDFNPVVEIAKRYNIHSMVLAFKKGLSTSLKYAAHEVFFLND